MNRPPNNEPGPRAPISDYRLVRNAIEHEIKETFSKDEFIQKFAQDFLCLPEGVHLNENEFQQIKTVYLHVVKRILAAHSLKWGGNISGNPEMVYGKFFATGIGTHSGKNAATPFDPQYLYGIIRHDFGHSLGLCIETYPNTPQSLVSKFLRDPIDGQEIVSRQYFEEEVFGLLFSTARIFGYRNKAKSIIENEEVQDFGTFVEKFLNSALEIIRKEALGEIFKRHNEDGNRGYKEQISLEALIQRIRNNPSEKLLEVLKEIYDNRDNPRVIADLVLKYTKPIFEKIKTRYSQF